MGQPRRHAVIAGTGRAGTSFLVRFMNECGLETSLDQSRWFSLARAGYEHRLDADTPLPYVIKDPALFTYCADLDLTKLDIDALIVPVRDLELAARSRVHQERLAFLGNPHMRHRNMQLAGATPGGVWYSLDVVDQARILAVGFHRLLHWAITNELPLFLLEFPRLVEDPDYILRELWPWLGEHCTTETARSAFSRSADAELVRVRTDAAEAKPIAIGAGEPDPEALDRSALVELLEQESGAVARAREELRSLSNELESRMLELRGIQDTSSQLRSQLQAEQYRNGELESELSEERQSAASAATAQERNAQQLSAIRASKSWRITAPLRSIRARRHPPAHPR